MDTTTKRLLQICAAFESDGVSPQIVIRVRNTGPDSTRFYCDISHVEVKGNGVLISLCGNGPTPDDAMENYLGKITGTTLVYNATSENRKEVTVI
jgi:hypothetical protein